MRIAYLLLHDFRFASIGIEDFAYKRFHFAKEYARRLSLLGHDVTLYVLSFGVHGKRVFRAEGYELKAFGRPFLFPPGLRFGNSHSLEVLRELDRGSPDLVHLHNYYLWNFPYVALWAKSRGMRLVAQYHGADPVREAKGFLYRPALRLCDRILVPLKGERDFLTKSLRLPASRVSMFPSTGVDTETFHRVAPPSSEPLLLYAGRVPLPSSYLWEKSPQYLIPMFKALLRSMPQARLTIAGDGPGLPSLKALARGFGVDQSIDFLGFIDHARLPQLYSRSRLTFVPFHLEEISTYWDGALQESLACGTPVVGFNNRTPGFKRLGLLVPTDPEKAAELISAALADEPWSERVRNDAPGMIAGSCGWVSMASRLDSLYAAIVGQGP